MSVLALERGRLRHDPSLVVLTVVGFFCSPRTSHGLEARVYVYPLPSCSIDSFEPAQIEAAFTPNPPYMPLHKAIVGSKYVVNDPREANLFYIPAPFFFWDGVLTCRVGKKPMPEKPFFTDGAARFLDGLADIPLPVEAKSVKGNKQRSIALWLRTRPGDASGRRVVVSTGINDDVGLYDIGLVDGCPAILSCGCPVLGGHAGVTESGAGRCSAHVADGRWHHITATFDGASSRLFVDGEHVHTAEGVRLNSRDGSVRFGQRVLEEVRQGAREACFCGEAGFRGEVEGLRLYDYALNPELVPYVPGGYSTTDSPCFREIREYVEMQPSFKRNNGWDHFVLFGSMDYPACFRANMPNIEEDFTLEHAWPAFARFSMLHLGSRVEICAGTQFWEMPQSDAMCWQRFFRSVTIPPYLEGEDFDCGKLEEQADNYRPVRVAYRGLAYSSMVERMALYFASKSPIITGLQSTGQVRLEFTNWTFESISKGQCTHHQAFQGLCPWSAVGRPQVSHFGSERKVNMKRRSLELWPQSETCLVMPGDGGYELRLFSMMNLGCIPVIIHSRGTTLPKIPFSATVPWHEFAIFWDLSHENVDHSQELFGVPGHVRAGLQILTQLLSMSPHVLQRKRQALLKWAPSFGWKATPSCQERRPRPATALDLTMNELLHRSQELSRDAAAGKWQAFSDADWLRKIPLFHVQRTQFEDLTGNGCPSGYPVCGRDSDPKKGDACYAHVDGVGEPCPAHCSRDTSHNCVSSEGEPCRVERCFASRVMGPDTDDHGLPRDKRQLRLLLISYSNRPALRKMTWPSLQRFCDLHPGRYHLELNDEPLLDPRNFHPAWNKLAFVRRAFESSDYHAIIWIDDDILITDPERDPIFDHMVSDLLPNDEKVVLASYDDVVSERVPLNTGLLVFRRDVYTNRLLKKLFQIGQVGRTYTVDGKWLQPSHYGFWDQDAIAVYAQTHGLGHFARIEHRKLQSFVRQKGGRRLWEKGDFAAHFTGIRSRSKLLETVREFMEENNISYGTELEDFGEEGKEDAFM
eukprot:TRINITY_DN121458_c0_g1_i1.p1 TRINITY_DN121458_c0_g1~~TRINITY_DN121458_c0_g1_i1.p1  ORF type:complete len:1033 (+),score=149.52 TRINITY_DN121458_c0_g1_i1:132-3230(+)